MRLALVLGLLAGGPLLALTPPPPYFENAVQDAHGVMWAYSRAEYNHIYSYDGKVWTAINGPFTSEQNAMPAFVVRMTDGTVACIWRVEKHQVGVTIQSGNQVRLLGTCDGDIPGGGLTVEPFADSQNRLWITGQNADIYRADDKGVTKVHTFGATEYTSLGPKNEVNEVHAVEDGHGRIWVWTNPRASNYASLRGVLIFTGDTPELHDSFGTIKGDRILSIAKANATHMWVAVSNDGIYRVDIDTFAMERVPDPAPLGLCCVHELRVIGNDLYAVESLASFKDSLWRLRAGTWKQLLLKFDNNPFSFIPRSWLPVKEGLLVESYGAGPWFIPTEGEPAQFSWRTGFPLNTAHALARFEDGSFFAIGPNDALFHEPLILPPQEKNVTPRCITLETDREWALGPGGHVWIIAPDKLTLNEWDGTQWLSHPCPTAKYVERILADSEGRIWPFTQNGTVPIDVFDTHTQKWQSYPSEQDAYITLRNKPPQFLNDKWFVSPQYSTDRKRIAYRIGASEIVVYDGTKWQKLWRKDITGKNEDNAVGVPWFDADNSLRVNLRPHLSYKLAGDKWTEVPLESHFPGDIWSENLLRESHPVLPENPITRTTESISVDNLGVTWFQWQNRLYKAMPGICLPVFGDDELSPFSVQQQLRNVYIDGLGNAFIEAAGSQMHYFLIKPKSALPHTTITVESTGKDSVTAHFDAHSTVPIQFHWQLDQAPVTVTSESSLILRSLPNGPHELTVFASDDQLQIEAVPVAARFTTHIDAKMQLAALIAQLSGTDYDARKVAIQALALQPESAVPALQKARLKADDSTQWWIDAALQEIASRSSQAPVTAPLSGKKH